MFSRVLLSLLIALFSGYAQAAAPTISIKASLPTDEPKCPFLDEKVGITYTDDENEGKQAVLTIQCAAKGTNTKTTRFTSHPVTIVKLPEQQTPPDKKKPSDYDELAIVPHDKKPFAWFNVDVDKDISSAAVGDLCTATVAISDNSARNASDDFKIGFKRIDGKPTAKVLEPITVGQEFRIGDLSMHNVGIPFRDLLLRECTAAEDPWVFRAQGNKLQRVYPISITSSETFGRPSDIDPNNNNLCLGAYDGFIGDLFTLGSDYTGCKIKLVKEVVTGGDAFAAMGAPQLAAASVTSNAGQVLLNTGAKPAAPAGISNAIVVHISTDRGQTWQSASNITGFTTTATDTGISISASNSNDNTVNMAVVAITNNDASKRWWRIVKGQ
ncbi:MAG: hypothetical protein OYH77_03540 [Pseudomonadota bacterium]|nr:hypothetical protein [Pseudomonadota bacterium]